MKEGRRGWVGKRRKGEKKGGKCVWGWVVLLEGNGSIRGK